MGGGAWPPKGLTRMIKWPSLQHLASLKKIFPPNSPICLVFLALAAVGFLQYERLELPVRSLQYKKTPHRRTGKGDRGAPSPQIFGKVKNLGNELYKSGWRRKCGLHGYMSYDFY